MYIVSLCRAPGHSGLQKLTLASIGSCRIASASIGSFRGLIRPKQQSHAAGTGMGNPVVRMHAVIATPRRLWDMSPPCKNLSLLLQR